MYLRTLTPHGPFGDLASTYAPHTGTTKNVHYKTEGVQLNVTPVPPYVVQSNIMLATFGRRHSISHTHGWYFSTKAFNTYPIAHIYSTQGTCTSIAPDWLSDREPHRTVLFILTVSIPVKQYSSRYLQYEHHHANHCLSRLSKSSCPNESPTPFNHGPAHTMIITQILMSFLTTTRCIDSVVEVADVALPAAVTQTSLRQP